MSKSKTQLKQPKEFPMVNSEIQTNYDKNVHSFLWEHLHKNNEARKHQNIRTIQEQP